MRQVFAYKKLKTMQIYYTVSPEMWSQSLTGGGRFTRDVLIESFDLKGGRWWITRLSQSRLVPTPFFWNTAQPPKL